MAAITSAQLLDDPIANYPPATVACFDPTCGALPRRKFDELRNAAFLQRLAAAGTASVVIGSSTGHGHQRTTAELEINGKK